MLGFLVRRRGLRSAIDLHQHKARRVILLLHEIKAGDARFLDALSRVGNRGLFEGLDVLRFYVNVNVND